MPPQRIGILGGSFDPVHVGHLRLASEARDQLGLDRVILVPAAVQPLKHASRAAPTAAEHRLAMLRLAAEGHPWLETSDLELRRPGPSYTVDTLRALREALGPDAELYFIAGADVLRDLDRWYRVDELLSLARFVVASRPGHPLVIPKLFEGRIFPLEIDAVDAAATDVRGRIAAGAPVDHLLPPAITQYIRNLHLYET